LCSPSVKQHNWDYRNAGAFGSAWRKRITDLICSSPGFGFCTFRFFDIEKLVDPTFIKRPVQ
jgi:hypothetical protein